MSLGTVRAQTFREYLATVNPLNGTFSIVNQIPGVFWIDTGPSGTAIDPVNNRYFFRGLDSLMLHDYLYTLDAATGNILYSPEPVPLNANDNYGQLEFDDSTQTLYGLYWNSAQQKEYFISVNETSGAFTFIDSIPGVYYILLDLFAYDQNHHTYFFSGETSTGVNSLYSINALTGQVINQPVIAPTDFNSIQYDNVNNTLYGNHDDTMLKIDPVTGSMSTIATIPSINGVESSYITFNDTSQQYTIVALVTDGSTRLFFIDTAGNIIHDPVFPVGLDSGENVIEMKCNSKTGIYYALHWGYQPICTADANWTYSGMGIDSIRFQVADMNDGDAYSWDFGDGTGVAGPADTIHQYAAPGSYTVCLYASIPYSTCADTLCRTVTVYDCTTTAAWISSDIGPDSVLFTASDTTTAATHLWDFGDGSTASGSTQIIHVYSTAGTYTVCFYSSVPGTYCSDTLCAPVTIKATPCNTTAAWALQMLGGESFGFTASDTNSAAIRIWNLGDGTVFDDSIHLTHSYSSPGTYEVCLYVYDGACSDTLCRDIDVVLGIDQTAGTMENVSIYPNPASQSCSILISDHSGKKYTARLIDIRGQEVCPAFIFSAGTFTFPVAQCAKGIYILKVTDSEGDKTQRKLVIE